MRFSLDTICELQKERFKITKVCFTIDTYSNQKLLQLGRDRLYRPIPECDWYDIWLKDQAAVT